MAGVIKADRLSLIRKRVEHAKALHVSVPFDEDVEWLIAEVERLRAARDVDRLGYAVVEMRDGPAGVEPYFFNDRVAADRYAAEVSEAHGPRLAVVEVHEAEEAAT